MFARLRFGFRLHVLPALGSGAVVLLTSVFVGVVGRGKIFLKGSPTSGILCSGLVASVLVFILLVRSSLKHDEQIAAVEDYQSHAYFQHVKIRNTLTKMQGVLDLCDHIKEDLNHQNCEAALRQQIRILRMTIGAERSASYETKAGDVVYSQEFANVLRIMKS